MMKPFAKTFETERGQIVALRHQDSDGSPAVVFMFDPGVEGLGVCQIAIGFSDDDEGENRRDEAFDALLEERAKRVVFGQIDFIRESFV